MLGVSIIARGIGIVDQNCRLLCSLATTLFRPSRQTLASDRGLGLMLSRRQVTLLVRRTSVV
jgi:hypothetical protein